MPRVKKEPTTGKTSNRKKTQPRPDDDHRIRKQMIAEAAYFKAEKRAFQGNDMLQDWLEAEEEINHYLDHKPHMA